MTLTKTTKLFLFRIISRISIGLFCLSFIGGVYRHDVPIEKYLKLGAEEQFNCVGQVLQLEESVWKAGGSCVLIDSVTLLSAAHVFISKITNDTTVQINGKAVKTYLNKGVYPRRKNEFQFLLRNTIVKADTIILHPNYLAQHTCDIAIIKLQAPIKGLKNIPLYTGYDELGDTVTGVGFGVSGPASKPKLVDIYNLKIAGRNIIDSIGGNIENGQFSMLYSDFDAPDNRNDCNKMGSSEPLELEYCTGGGDSGGPLFTYKEGKIYLVGITSGAAVRVENLLKNGYYCGVSGWTRISALIHWIQKNK